MGYYLLENPNPSGPNFYETRRADIRGIVIHTAENLPDFDGADDGAERVARYASTTTRDVSWHVTVDSDSTVVMLPDEYTGWHVRGYNSSTLGVEIATKADAWTKAPASWINDVLDQLAAVVAKWCRVHDIPPERVTQGDYDGGAKGLLGHASLDPSRRRDPGGGFPWGELERRVAALLWPSGDDDEPEDVPADDNDWWDELMADIGLLKVGSRGPEVRACQDLLSLYGAAVNVDGIFGPETQRGVIRAQATLKCAKDGIVGPETWAALIQGGKR